jgi:CubicO group peptidase (beta-lactamase class C family)
MIVAYDVECRASYVPRSYPATRTRHSRKAEDWDDRPNRSRAVRVVALHFAVRRHELLTSLQMPSSPTSSIGSIRRAARFPHVALTLALAAACTRGTAAADVARTAHAPTGVALDAVLDAQVPALLARYGVASVSMALIEDGRVVLERAYGEQSAGVPATVGTLYGLASVTKPVSAETLLRLAAAGRFSLDEPVASAWIDPDVAGDPRARVLTVRHALAHQTGLPNWRGRSPGGKLAFAFVPGTAYAYAGEGYDYAARFTERKLGRNFEDLAQEMVFGPLGMRSTSYSRRGWMSGRLAVPLDSAGRWGEPQVEDSSHWNAGNNLITTAGDYARFVASVMRGEGLTPALDAERLRPARGPQMNARCQATPTACPRAISQALGWVRLDYAAGPVFLHTGLNGRPGGERTVAYFDPARRRGVVVLTSGSNGARLYADVAALVDPGAPIVAFLAAQ